MCLPERGLVLPDWTECEISGYGKDSECKHTSRLIHGTLRFCMAAIVANVSHKQVGDTHLTEQQRAV